MQFNIYNLNIWILNDHSNSLIVFITDENTILNNKNMMDNQVKPAIVML